MLNYINLLFVPGKIGFLFSNSAKIQPTDQTSTDAPYSVYANNNSGALYHLVAT